MSGAHAPNALTPEHRSHHLFGIGSRSAAAAEAGEAACAQADDHHRYDLAAYEMAVERARYEADRALRQRDNVEPKNRLIARTS
jgi:hypothetical protein